VLLALGTLLAVGLRAGEAGRLGVADWAAIRFTLLQALLSAGLSIIAAVPVARALARRSFPGRSLLIAVMGAPFILPVIVAILGLLAVFGRGGIVNSALDWAGLPAISIYGLHGVVLAHVFFNLPLAVRLILQGWATIPAERFRVAASLDMSVWRFLEWPMLRATVPGVFLAIFLICLTSFAVALTLGGGPRATTVELAIYQAIRFDFDLGRAAVLAGIQFTICAAAAIAAWWIAIPSALGGGLDRVVQRWDTGGATRAADLLAIGLAALFLIVPLAFVLARGITGIVELPASVWIAAGRSILVAIVSAFLCGTAALSLALLRGSALAGLAGTLPLAASGLVLGTGLFIVVHPILDPARLALPVTAIVNAALALPFAYRALAPAVEAAEGSHGRLADTLGITGLSRLRIVILPRLRGPLGFSLGLAAALSMGDLGVIALFAGDAGETLPLAMYRLMGAYQMDAAAGAGVLLVLLSFGLFWLFDRGGRRDSL
jgi:thiamine transport system permease protein